MPSPFPGMDPYLETPALWPDLHLGLMVSMQETLGAQLRPKYLVRVENRVYVAEPVMITLIDEEIHEARLEIIDRVDRQVVTVIEVLSPTNRIIGSKGRESFVQKRAEVIASPSHWIEIDLLREGARLVPLETIPPYDYSVRLSRADRRAQTCLWPIRLHQRLPVIEIPLRAPDADAKLDLQIALTTVYDRANFDLDIDYRKDPDPPLSGPLAQWSEQLLRGKELR